jgi:hypothetical protein
MEDGERGTKKISKREEIGRIDWIVQEYAGPSPKRYNFGNGTTISLK